VCILFTVVWIVGEETGKKAIDLIIRITEEKHEGSF
jgi:hypothetical protein